MFSKVFYDSDLFLLRIQGLKSFCHYSSEFSGNISEMGRAE